MATITLNTISITKKINKALGSQRYKTFATRAAETRFNITKDKFINEFDNHDVTQELLEGPTADNISGILYGYGNLFSFFGFPSNTNPIERLRNYLINNIRILKTPTFVETSKGVIYNFQVKTPDADDIYGITPMPDGWSDMSWVEAVEKGIGTLSYYIYHLFFGDPSRSGTGLQLKKRRKWIKIKDRTKRTPYVVNLLKEFIGRFK